MEKFLSCDWGSSMFRLKLVASDGFIMLAEEKTSQGISNTYQDWKQTDANEKDRSDFYLNIIREKIRMIENRTNASLDGVPLIMSGMASSSIGMMEIRYKTLPVLLDGSDLETKIIPASDHFRHDICLISGARTADDAMRGEETKLIGCVNEIGLSREEAVFIFPGTHSKHLYVKEGKLVDIRTYMTGECFALLSGQSILANAVEKTSWPGTNEYKSGFVEGIKAGASVNLLHGAFLTRTNDLFGKFSKAANYYYLSGLLIASELKEWMHSGSVALILVSDVHLGPLYTFACRILGIGKSAHAGPWLDADQALVKGQFAIYKQHR
ncbi:MAG TPA: 2-dehydro-3-deoxygalactonokinase [Puia sp.]|nr:2-dehydro-3-deoxygalactonokinase [Puia sp.]